MILKLAILRHSFYFNGTIALTLKDNAYSPKEYDLDSLTDNEVFGLMRAIKTQVVSIVQGEKEFLTRFKEVEARKKPKRDAVAVEPVVAEVVTEQVEEKTSEKEEIQVEDKVEDTVEIEEEVEAVVEEKIEVKATPVKKTTTKKTTTK